MRPERAPPSGADGIPRVVGDERWRRFLARRSARVGLWILAILATSAAWAPFLANDRPYVLVSSDHGALERARGEIVPLAESFAQRARVAEEAGAKGRERALRAVTAEARALEMRLDVLEPAIGAASLAELRRAIADDRPAGVDPVAAARGVRDALAGRTLSAPRTRTFPLFASLDAADALFALLPGVALAACAVKKLSRKPRSGRRAAAFATAVAVSIAALVHVLGNAAPFTAPGALKSAVASGSIVAESAVFPPIPFGFAETNLGEAWRPPTWLAAARMDEDGRYREGQRASSPSAGRPAQRFGEPALDAPWRHVLGTDALGRDVAARVLWGGRISLAIGFAAALLLSLLGVLLGSAAGYWGGFVDALISRTIEVVLCFPAFFLVLCAVAWTDPDVVPVPFAIVLVIAAVNWTSTARLVRAEALRVVASDYVTAARAQGLHPARIVVRHVLPNSIGPALIAFGFAAGGAIGVESSLAFLGLGARLPVPSWGALVGEARGADQAWAWIAPGILVFLAVLAWVLVAEAAREALDARAVGATEAAEAADSQRPALRASVEMTP
jgi:peptide/nickel transport system permease protein